MDARTVPSHILQRLGALAASPRGPWLLSAAFVASLAWQAADVTWRLLPPAGPAAPTAESSRAGPATDGGNATATATRLANLHLFGAPPAPDAPAPVVEAPETSLDLTLKGLFLGGDGQGNAIIAVGKGAEDVYTVGDELLGNTRIAVIHRDRVIIERNGQPEALRLEHAPEMAPPPRRASADRARRRPQRAAIARQLREQFVSNPGSLARKIRFHPAVRAGELIGYRLASRSNDISLEQLGLRSSDIVTRINGVPLNDPRQASQVLSSLRTADSINVDYLRGEATHSLSIPIGAPG